jgi:hydroxymethylbilane synthase
MKLRLGTRGSPLALAQSGLVAASLRSKGHEVELITITTSGDRFAVESPAEAMKKLDGGKGLFVKEIEEALLEGKADIAVHSAKDLPGELAEGLVIAAYPEREDAGDVLIAKKPLAELPAGAKVATSSLRRQIQLKQARPELVTVGIRGNIDTRLRKLDAGEFDGLVLAAAGLRRLAVERSVEPLELVSAPGQGALALECRADRGDVAAALAELDDPKCRLEVEAERALLRAIGGGCLTPLGCRGEADGSWIRLTVFWSDPEGKNPIKLSARSKTEPAKLESSVKELSDRVRQLASSVS